MNRRKNRVGHLFQGRSKTLIVEREAYFSTVMGYVLLNRVRAKLVRDVYADPWNSVSEMLTLKGSRLARGPLWEYLFGHEFDERKAVQHVRECKDWLDELDVDGNRRDFEAGHRGSFLGTPEYRARILKIAERRQQLGGGVRRKTDRHRKKWTWSGMERAARTVVEDREKWRELWRTQEGAVRDIHWYIAHVGACWTLNQILEHVSRNTPTRRPNTMVISRIRQNPKKYELAEAALHLCLSGEGFNV